MDELIARLRRISVSSLCDADKTMRACDPAIHALVPVTTVAGPAVTVVADGDLLGMLAVVTSAPAGSVLVVDSRGSTLAASGELFATEARRRGVAAIVVDGYYRDLRRLPGVGLPVFARGSHPAAGPMAGPAEFGGKIRCGGIDVSPGDIVVGDEDGVLIAPPERVAALIDRAEEIERTEAGVLTAIEAGTPFAELSNAAEHVAARAEGRESTFTFHT
ncbi:RraA family protein [Pseudonocardia sp.]|uniref:RraA family protein n=1 Tax=Pseudonocardia sp. TaxID=60912 RepID=UPI003D0B2644